MKKILMICILFFMILGLVACGEENLQTEKIPQPEISKYSVQVKMECVGNLFFSKYDVKILVDDVEISILEHGTTNTYNLELEEGEHTLRVEKEDDSSIDGTVDFFVTENMALNYKLSLSSDQIEMEEIEETESEDDDSTETTQVTVTMSEKEFMGMEYLEAEKMLREMGFTVFEYQVLETDDQSKSDGTIGAVEIKNWEFGKGDFSKEDTYDSDAIVVLWYYDCEEVVPNLTVENCADLAALVALKDPCDPSVSKFAIKYSGQIIEFDGCVTAMQNHGDFDTRYDILINTGDFDINTMYGPNFRLTDVNAFDMELDTFSLRDILNVGTNVHVVAEVEDYNSNTSIFELDVIKVEIR